MACFLLLNFFVLGAQDKIYLLDGKVKSGKITEISTDLISIEINNAEENISKLNILLIEYQSGKTEMITSPAKNVIYNPASEINPYKSEEKDAGKVNYVSLNSLALFNADISVFYEYQTKNKLLGFGVMGAYNFNLASTWPNGFIDRLHNSKKNYDLGATFNFYPEEFSGETSIYFGLMIKYTNFSFDKVKIDSTRAGNQTTANISYSKTNGSQLATFFTAGTHTFLTEQFYLRTLAGLGVFKLNGDYKKEFNAPSAGNKNSATSFNFLPKIYLGVNIGFNF